MGAVAKRWVKNRHDDPFGSLTANPSYGVYVFWMSLFGENLGSPNVVNQVMTDVFTNPHSGHFSGLPRRS